MNEIINDYLWFGYLPNSNIDNFKKLASLRKKEDISYSVDSAFEIFKNVFDTLVDNGADRQNIIPLSGGVDSRAILAALIERVDKSKITTITFGVPGQLDYDIGVRVAKEAQVKNISIDLRDISVDLASIKNSVKKSPWTAVPDSFFNQYVLDKYTEEGNVIWTGFLGGLTGDYIPSGNFSEEIIHYFLLRELRVKDCQLYRNGFYPRLYIPSDLEKYNKDFSLAMLLHYGYHNACFTAPILAPMKKWSSWSANFAILANSKKVIAPFADERWAGYWIFSPLKYRSNQVLFLEMLNNTYPDLFSLPFKKQLGVFPYQRLFYFLKKLNHITRSKINYHMPWTNINSTLKKNYLDYDAIYRKREDYQSVLFWAFEFLQSNNIVPWLNLEKLWNDHLKRKRNLGEAFNILIGLSVNLDVHKF